MVCGSSYQAQQSAIMPAEKRLRVALMAKHVAIKATLMSVGIHSQFTENRMN